MKIEGETWNETLSDAEYAAWDTYALSHEWLLVAGYHPTLCMFLAHFRRGINLAEGKAEK